MQEPKQPCLLPCPFCGEVPTLAKHFREPMWRLVHRCKVMGAMCIEWSDPDRIARRWNTRHEAANAAEMPCAEECELMGEHGLAMLAGYEAAETAESEDA